MIQQTGAYVAARLSSALQEAFGVPANVIINHGTGEAILTPAGNTPLPQAAQTFAEGFMAAVKIMEN
jgi:hypothetical protein